MDKNDQNIIPNSGNQEEDLDQVQNLEYCPLHLIQ